MDGCRLDGGTVDQLETDYRAAEDRTALPSWSAACPSRANAGAKRRQGRPPNHSEPVGPQPILNAVARLLVRRPKISLLRRDVATEAQVTSSLVSYYFPNRDSLIDQACKPVFDRYIASITAIIRSDASDETRMRQLIRTLLCFDFETGHLIDAYMDEMQSREDPDEAARLADMSSDVTDFISGIADRQGDGSASGPVLQSMIWGVCKAISNQPHIRPIERDMDALLDTLADQVFRLVAIGALSRFAERTRMAGR